MVRLVERTTTRIGWTVRRVLKRLGLWKARYYEWIERARADQLADSSTAAGLLGVILEEEKQAVIRYAPANPKDLPPAEYCRGDPDRAALRGAADQAGEGTARSGAGVPERRSGEKLLGAA